MSARDFNFLLIKFMNYNSEIVTCFGITGWKECNLNTALP